MLTVGTQRRAFASVPERRNENKNVNKYEIFPPRVGIEHTTSRFTGTICAPAPRLASRLIYIRIIIQKEYKMKNILESVKTMN